MFVFVCVSTCVFVCVYVCSATQECYKQKHYKHKCCTHPLDTSQTCVCVLVSVIKRGIDAVRICIWGVGFRV